MSGLVLLLLCQAGCSEINEAEVTFVSAARKAFINGEYLHAQSIYEKYLQFYNKGRYRLEAWQHLADINQYVKNNPEKAIKILESAILEFKEFNDTYFIIQLRIANIYDSLKHYEKSNQLYYTILANKKLSETQRNILYLQNINSKKDAHNYADALYITQQALLQTNELLYQAHFFLELAMLFQKLEQSDKAYKLYKSIYNNDNYPSDIRARAGFALVSQLKEKHNIEEASSILRSLQKIYPNPLLIEQTFKNLQ